MANLDLYTIIENSIIARDVYKMRLIGNTEEIWAPGQFVNIKIDGFFLRRPISICSYCEGQITLIYKILGKGTEKLSKMQPNQSLDMLVGLGNGFSLSSLSDKKIVLVAGGVGLPPLYGLAEDLVKMGLKNMSCVLGFRNEKDVFYEKEFNDLGLKVFITTEDGTKGKKGFVTDRLKVLEYDYYFACGPMPMLKAVHSLGKEGQLSFEERMGCGFGACMGCTCKTSKGNKRICTEGPVFSSEEVIL